MSRFLHNAGQVVPMRYRILHTPTGPFAVCEHDTRGLRLMWVDGPDDARLAGADPDPDLQPELTARLAQYFGGAPVDFDDVSLPDADDDFFAQCWAACRTIARGTTRTYGQLAGMAGATTGAARAAGQAMRHNPLPIVIPCHRVVAAGARIGGFGGSVDPAGVNLRTKRWLLTMEGALEPGLWGEA